MSKDPNSNSVPLKKLFYFLKPLSAEKAKWKLFREYLRSPLHAGNAQHAARLDAIKKVLNMAGEVAEEKLCEALFPDRMDDYPKAQNNLRRISSTILEHYYKFEALLRFQNEEVMQWRYVLQEANARQWVYFPWLYKKKAVKALQDCPQTETYYLHRMDLTDQFHKFNFRKNGISADQKESYQGELQALWRMHAITLLKLACNIRNQTLLTRSGQMPEIPLLDPLLEEIRTNFEFQEALVQIYYHIYMGLAEPDKEGYYEGFKHILFENPSVFGQEEARKLFQHANNYCTRRYNHFKALDDREGMERFQNELTELYENQIDHGIIFLHAKGKKMIDPGDFKNIVVHFLKNNKSDYAKQFMDDYGEHILKEWSKDALNFCRGIWYFFEGEFGKANAKFNPKESEFKTSHDRYFALSVQTYRIKVPFELKDIEGCDRMASNLKKSMGENQYLPTSVRERTALFCQYMLDICKIKGTLKEMQGEALDKLEMKIAAGPACVSLDWIKEKIAQMRT